MTTADPIQQMTAEQRAALWQMRAVASETALIEVVKVMRTHMGMAEAFMAKVAEIDARFPAGDSTGDGVQQVMLKAIRASTPQWAALSDQQILDRLQKAK